MPATQTDVKPLGLREPKVCWTIFDDVRGTQARAASGTWADVVGLITDTISYSCKEACPLFKGAKFGSARTPAGSLRSDDNLEEIWIIEGDYDGGEVTVDQAVAMLERHQIRALVFTTASHLPHKPRWRVLAPLSQGHSPVRRSGLVARLNGALGGILASESFASSQAYYFGRVQGAPFEAAVTFSDVEEGRCIDEIDELDQIAVGRQQYQRVDPITGTVKTTSVADGSVLSLMEEQLGRKLKTGDGRRDILKSMAASLSARFQGYEQIVAELRRIVAAHFDPDDPVDWPNIERMVAEIHRKDRARSELGQAIVAPFLDKLREKHAVAPGLGTQSLGWVQAVQNYEAPLRAWREPPPVQWAVEGLIRTGTVGGLIAPGATGKTTLLITLGICHALGRPFMGRQVRRGGFLMLSLDDTQDDLDAAVGLVLKAMELQDSDVQEVGRHLRVISLQGRTGPRTFNVPGSPGLIDPQMLQALSEACDAVPQLVGVCVDTLRQFAGGPTNDEQTIMAVSSACAWLAVQTGAYFAIPHHTGKAQAREDAGDMYAGSGSAAIADNARFLLVLSGVTKRSDLAQFDRQVQHDQSAGICTVLRLSSRRGSIRHQAEADVFIVRRGYLMQAVATVQPPCEQRTRQLLGVIGQLTAGGEGTSKNAVYVRVGGNKGRLLEEIDDLVDCGLVVSGFQGGSSKSLRLLGLTAAGASLLGSPTSGSEKAVPA